MKTDDLLSKVETTKKKAMSGKKSVKPVEVEASSGTVERTRRPIQLRLPDWDDKVRGIPNPIARSAVFRVGSKKTPRKFYKRFQVASINGIKIEVTGEELRVEDEDVWLAILHVSRVLNLGDRVEFTGYGILKELGWGYSKACYERLRNSIDRLSANNITVSTVDESQGFAGSLIRKFAWQENGEPMKRWVVYLEPELIRLFGEVNYTLIDWQMRMSLKKPMAKKLFTFYYTHRQPFAYSVENLRELIGSDATRISTFRAQVKESLDELLDVGMISKWQIDKFDRVLLTRNPVRGGIVQ